MSEIENSYEYESPPRVLSNPAGVPHLYKAGVRAVSSNEVAGRTKSETKSATPVKAWVSTFRSETPFKYFAFTEDAFAYKHVVTLIDIDIFRHMSYANYLKLMYQASDALFFSVLNMKNLHEARFKILQTSMKFKRQVVVGDELIVRVNSFDIQEFEFTLKHIFFIEKQSTMIAIGEQRYCVQSIDGFSSIAIPTALSNALKSIELKP